MPDVRSADQGGCGSRARDIRMRKKQQGGSMSRISRLERSEVTPEISALFDRIFAQRGNVPNMFRVMAHRPDCN